MQDRRRSHRLEIKLPARYALTGAPEGSPMATTLNVNATGACLSLSRACEVGNHTEAHITLPSGQQITMNAAVIWVRELPAGAGCMAGIKFLEPMTPDEKTYVQFYAQEVMVHFGADQP